MKFIGQSNDCTIHVHNGYYIVEHILMNQSIKVVSKGDAYKVAFCLDVTYKVMKSLQEKEAEEKEENEKKPIFSTPQTDGPILAEA